jgi:hypothetical protein
LPRASVGADLCACHDPDGGECAGGYEY